MINTLLISRAKVNIELRILNVLSESVFHYIGSMQLATVFLLMPLLITAQNLVPNPGFETYRKIPSSFTYNSKEFNKILPNWTLPNLGTSDYFHSRSKGKAGTIKNNFTGTQKPIEGDAYAGFYLYEAISPDYREYLQVKLLKPLLPGKKYAVTFYVSLSDASAYSLDRLGILFTEKITRQKNSKVLVSPASMETADSLFFENKESWTLVRLEYLARGGESFLVIGNFRKGYEIHLKSVDVNQKNYIKQNGSYYFIDQVCVSEIPENGKDECPCEMPGPSIETVKADTVADTEDLPVITENQPQIFRSVFFDTDKAVLKSASFPSLDSLAQYLLAHPGISIEISGHTDNEGDEAHNYDLSGRRAKAVADYFILKGISQVRITSYGYGSSRPVSSNATPEGRAQNRRVEYRLFRN